MKSIYIFILPLLPLLCNCSGADDYASLEPQPLEKIRFEVGMTADISSTRVTTNTDFVSTWQEGDAIGVYVVKGDGGLKSSGNYVSNMKLTLGADDNWTTSTDIYRSVNDELHFYAYYPYDAGMTDPTNYDFYASGDQRPDANHAQSHLLLATATSPKANNEPVKLNFSQAMAMVQVEVDRGAGMPPFGSDVTVEIGWVTSGVRNNLNTGTQTLRGIAKVTMHQVAGTSLYRALLPAQKLSGDCVITLRNTAGTMYHISTAAAGAELTAGKVHKYKLRMPGVKESYAVGDVYPSMETPLGIVFEVTEDGKHGKIVELRDGFGVWSTEGVATGATNATNGMENMNTLYTFTNDSMSGYPAFEWVHGLNGGGATNYYTNPDATGVWYLPAGNELVTLMNVYKADSEAFNAKLEAAGGAVLGGNAYWSSTDLNSMQAYYYWSGDGTLMPLGKSQILSVRAIMSF